MKTTYYHVKAQAPISIGNRQLADQAMTGSDYIPGTVLRGALAQHLTTSGKLDTASDAFTKIFVDHQTGAIFRNAYVIRHETDIPQVIPKTTVIDKHDPEKRLFDVLIDRYCVSKLSIDFLSSFLFDSIAAPPSPYYVIDRKGNYHLVEVDTRFVSGMGVHQDRNVGSSDQSHMTHVISEYQRVDHENIPTQFLTSISFDEDLTKSFQELKYVGGGSTRGLGHIQVEAVSTPKLVSLSDRLNQFNETLKARWMSYAAVLSSDMALEGTYFALDLQSNAIFRTVDKRPTTLPDVELKKIFKDIPITIPFYQAEYDYHGGWNGAWQLPRPTNVITKMGGCYLCHTPETIDHVTSILSHLEIHGLGEQTLEGFGQVSVCNRLHTELREEMK